jgi:hypothetical protein
MNNSTKRSIAAFILPAASLLFFSGPFPRFWMLFFFGLYPGTAESGQPGYDFSSKIGIPVFCCVMALVYTGLIILSAFKNQAKFAWFAVVLFWASGIVGFLRVASAFAI